MLEIGSAELQFSPGITYCRCACRVEYTGKDKVHLTNIAGVLLPVDTSYS